MRRMPPLAGLAAPVCGLAGLAGLTGTRAWAEAPQPLPTPFPMARYQQMSARSPFAVASAAAPAAAAADFAAQLYVDGVAHVGQKDFVAIKSRDPDKPVMFVAVGDTTEDGMKVERVTWSDDMGKSTVDVMKGGEKATLNFDQQVVKTNGQPGMQPGMQAPDQPMLPPRPIDGPYAHPPVRRFPRRLQQ